MFGIEENCQKVTQLQAKGKNERSRRSQIKLKKKKKQKKVIENVKDDSIFSSMLSPIVCLHLPQGLLVIRIYWLDYCIWQN